MIFRSPLGRLTGLLPVLAALGCAAPEPPLAQTPPPVVTVSQPLVRDNLTDWVYFTGRIEPVEKVDVRARVRGHLIKIGFQDGQIVHKGDLLFEIDPRPYEASLEQAKAQLSSAQAALELANAEYKRTVQLVNRNAASREELDVITGKRGVATGDINKAKAAADEARLNLDFTKVTSPIDGRISKPEVTVGNLINAGGGDMLLTTIVSLNPIYCYFDVDENTVQHYMEENRKKGVEGPKDIKKAKIPVWLGLGVNANAFPFEGILDFVDNRVDPGTGTVKCRGLFDNPRDSLIPGFFARVRCEGPGSGYKALLVPDRAVGTDQGQKFVYVVNADNKVEYRKVRLGALQGGLRVLLPEEGSRPGAGVRPGEWVIVNGLQRVLPGKEVKPEQEKLAAPPDLTASSQKAE